MNTLPKDEHKIPEPRRISYGVYVKVDGSSRITAINSDAFLTDLAEWIKIDEGYGDKYHHAQGNYSPKPIMTEGGAYRYKLVDGAPVECAAEEIQAQEAANKPKITAPHNILAGEYVTVSGVLYKATENIPNGEPIIVGQNAIATTYEEQLYELKGE